MTTVLVVEDDPVVRATIVADLTEHGFDIVQTENVDKAIEALAARQIDSMVADIELPGRDDGFDLADWLRRHCPAVRVVLGSIRPHWLAANSPLGKVPFLMKPYDMPRLRALLRGEADPGLTRALRPRPANTV